MSLIRTILVGLCFIAVTAYVCHTQQQLAFLSCGEAPRTEVGQIQNGVKIDEPPQEFVFNVSAYCPCPKCCGQYADGITASGHKIQPGDKFVAADKRFPFGTMLDIPGYGIVPVLDRGGAIKGNKLDVFFPTHQEALNWGRQYLKVKVCH